MREQRKHVQKLIDSSFFERINESIAFGAFSFILKKFLPAKFCGQGLFRLITKQKCNTSKGLAVR